MTNKISKIISYFFHPLLMTFYCLSILYLLCPQYLGLNGLGLKALSLLLLFIFFYTFIFPSLISFYLKKYGFIKSLNMENLKDRPVPLMVTALIYFILAYFFISKNPSLGITGYIIGANGTVIFILAIISLKWQISAHMAGIVGFWVWLACYHIYFSIDILYYPVLLILILVGIVASARLKLNAHTPLQIIGGGFLSLIAIISVFNYLF